jgi:hypothetical protein
MHWHIVSLQQAGIVEALRRSSVSSSITSSAVLRSLSLSSSK